jgi:hypothetical protein
MKDKKTDTNCTNFHEPHLCNLYLPKFGSSLARPQNGLPISRLWSEITLPIMSIPQNFMLVFLAMATPPSGNQPEQQQNPIMAFLPMILLIAIVFILIRRFSNKTKAGIFQVFLVLVLSLVCMCISPLLSFWVFISSIVGKLIGDRKGRGGAGLLFGALLGPIGWLIILLGPDLKAEQEAAQLRKCPFCAELVQREAKVCKHCGKDITPDVAQPAPVTPKPVLQTQNSEKTTADSQIPCPHCGQGLKISTLKQGENWCSSCFQKFIVE